MKLVAGHDYPQIHTSDSWKCFPMTLPARPFWYGCASVTVF